MNKNIKLLNVILITGTLLISCNKSNKSRTNLQSGEKSKFHELKGPYLGQKPPGMTPEIFASGIISDGKSQGVISFSADGSEIFFSCGISDPFYVSIPFHSFIKDGRWTEPLEIPAQRFDVHRLTINPDASKLFFLSNTMYDENLNGPPPRNSIFYMNRTDDGWETPKRIDFGEEFPHPCSQTSIAGNGSLYFQCNLGGPENSGQGNADIYMAEYSNGEYLTPVKLSSAVNSSVHECHPYIAPDESYLIFDGCRPEQNYGNFDLYISFRDQNGEWSKAINMGPKVNSPRDERRSFVSFDGKYLFFNGRIEDGASALPDQPVSLKEFQDFTNSAGNGRMDIYWVDAKVIEELRLESLKK